MILIRAILGFFLVSWARAAFLETLNCKDPNINDYKFEKTLMDVALDEDHKILKFFMNTKVINMKNLSSVEPVIVDVNTTTNKFTTFHAQIWFLGKLILDENKRFCEMVGVKNTSEYLLSPRFGDVPKNRTITINPNEPHEITNQLLHYLPGHRRELLDLEELEQLEPFEQLQELERLEHLDFDPLDDLDQDLDDLDQDLEEVVDVWNEEREYYVPQASGSETPSPISITPLNTDNNEPEDIGKSFASTNKTIESLFGNSTGQYVSCPLYVNDSIYMYYEVDVSEHFGQMGSYAARFSIVSSDYDSESIGCSRVYITPCIGEQIQEFVLFGALLLVLATIIINFLTIIYSSYQESSNPFLFTASTICNEELLKQLDATVQRIIVYFQFALFTAGLNLNYPGFYQPVMSLLKWTALLGFSVLGDNNFFQSTERDNVYITYNISGLNSLAYFSDYRAAGVNWWNFIITLIIWIGLQIFGQVCYFLMSYLITYFRKGTFISFSTIKVNYKRSLSFALGIALNNFMVFFGYPFLILTMYLFYLSGKDEDKYHPSIDTLRYDAFSRNVSYDNLFTPMSYIHFYDPYSDETEDFQVDDNLLENIRFNTTNGNITTETVEITSDASNQNVAVAPLVVSAILFVFWLSIAVYFVLRYLITVKKFKLAMNPRISKLYTSVNTILVWAFFYHHYSPSKTYYVILDIALLVMKLIVVSLVQSNGMAQVICLIVLELVSFGLVLIFKPFYLRITWNSSKWMIPMARLLVTILCIPFIPNLELSDNVLTYTALAQFIIHLVIAAIFFIQLLICFIRTVYSIYKHKYKDKAAGGRKKGKEKLSNVTSIDDFNRQFEYQPVDNLLLPITNYTTNFNKDDDLITDNDTSTTSETNSRPVEIDNPDFYYRSNAEYNLRNHLRSRSFSTDSNLDNASFEQQQEFSNRRKKQNDYTTREADLIYKKYFIDDEIDPDIKQLWESRKDRLMREHATSTATPKRPGSLSSTSSIISSGDLNRRVAAKTNASTKDNNGFSHIFKSLIKKPEELPTEKGFSVSRPRPLIVKTLDNDIGRNNSSKTCQTSRTTKTMESSSVEGFSSTLTDE